MSPDPHQVPVAVPVLPVSDLVRSVAWYERLGFATVATYPGYAILALADPPSPWTAEIHLVELAGLGPMEESTSGAYLRVVDADATFARWSAMGAPVIAAPADQPYGIREFATEDLDGNLWRVGSTIGSDAPEVDAGWAPPDDASPTAAGTESISGTPAPAPAGPDDDAPSPASERTAASGEAPTDGSPGTSDAHWLGIVDGDGRCAGCGLAPGELPARALGAEVRDEVHAFGELLRSADDDAVRVRGADGSWSALEYGVHVRDLLTVFADRIVRALTQDEPEMAWWDHVAAVEDGFANESNVEAVADDLGRNASHLSSALRMVTDDDWQRSAVRIRPDGSRERFTIELLARFTLHEVRHHRVDAERALAAAP